MRRPTDGKPGKKGSFLLRHVPSENGFESARRSGDQSAPIHATQASVHPGDTADKGSPDTLVAAIGDILLSEWMTENLPALRKMALTSARAAANTPGPQQASPEPACEDAT